MSKTKTPKVAQAATPDPEMRNNADVLENFRQEKQKQGFLSTYLSDKKNNLDPASKMRLSDFLNNGLVSQPQTTNVTANTLTTNPNNKKNNKNMELN